MATEEENKTSQLLSHLKGLVKQYLIYDAQGRVMAAYTAPISTPSGKPCVRTMYAFKNGTSTDIIARKEENKIWNPDDENWDQDSLYGVLPSPLVNS